MQKLVYSNPLVTVYIPTYNRIELLKRAVNSVLNQTYQNLEVIIVDDCSKDGTQEYLNEIAKKEKRISCILKQKNSGACISRNMAISKANGLFITGLDDDDYFEKSRIELFLRAASNNQNEAYCTSTKVKTSKSIIVSPGFLNRFRRSKIKSYRQLLKQNFVGNQIFIKTDFLRKSGGFDKNLKAWQDLECWFNLMKNQNININYLKKPTQVIDLSHEHERITKNNIKNVELAFEYISKKHSLNKLDRIILRGQLVQYRPLAFSAKRKIILFIITQQKFYLTRIFKGGA